MKKGAVYYFLQAGIERSCKYWTQAQAERHVAEVMQRHNPRVLLKTAVVGVRGSKTLQEFVANCAK